MVAVIPEEGNHGDVLGGGEGVIFGKNNKLNKFY